MKHYLLGLLILMGLSLNVHAQGCSPFPCVVTSVTLINQSRAIPATTIYTPSTDGLFRVSAYLSTTRAHAFGDEFWQLNLAWTDENGTRKASTTAGNNSSNAGTASFVVRDLASQPLGYTTMFNLEGGGPINYNLLIVVEELE